MTAHPSDLAALRALVEAVTDRNATWDQCRVCAFTASAGLVRHDPNCPVPAATAALARLEGVTEEAVAQAFLAVVGTSDARWDALSDRQRDMWKAGGSAVLALLRGET